MQFFCKSRGENDAKILLIFEKFTDNGYFFGSRCTASMPYADNEYFLSVAEQNIDRYSTHKIDRWSDRCTSMTATRQTAAADG